MLNKILLLKICEEFSYQTIRQLFCSHDLVSLEQLTYRHCVKRCFKCDLKIAYDAITRNIIILNEKTEQQLYQLAAVIKPKNE